MMCGGQLEKGRKRVSKRTREEQRERESDSEHSISQIQRG